VMFFAAFFGALFYARQFALPWLGGEGDGMATNSLLWSTEPAPRTIEAPVYDLSAA